MIENGLDAQKGNAEAATLSAGSACTDGETVCAGTEVGQCVGGKLVTTACSSGTQCFILPLVNKAGTVSLFFSPLPQLGSGVSNNHIITL